MNALVLTVLLGAAAASADDARPAPATADAPAKAPDATSAAGREAASRALHALFASEWERWMEESPSWASTLGDRRWNRRWPDLSFAAIEKSHARDQAALAALEAIDREALVPADRLSYDLFRRRAVEEIESHGFRTWLVPLTQRGGIQTLNELALSLRFVTVSDFEDWIARMAAIGGHVDDTIALMRQGIKEGIVHPRVIMERVPAQITHQVVEDPERSPFYKPFRELPAAVAGTEGERLRAAARAAIRDQVVPAYRRFQAFFTSEYLPACRATVGALALPRGAELYAFRTRSYTTTSLTPAEVHELGLKEVARIRAEMERVMASIGFRDGFAAFFEHLRTAPRFYHSDPEALLAEYRAVSKRADPQLVKLFGKLPRMPYGVEPIPAESAPDTTTAYYSSPAPDGSRAGTYYVNLYRPEVRPRYEIEALTLHEAVPGHHFQIALAQELPEVPKFRRHTGYTAFSEGWGLYAERLGEEMGFYQDPYSKFGQLTYEMWRAVRLVVDTGIHSLGWPREKAIEYFKANAAKSEHDIVNEIDRYIAWPGQALAYKVGEIRIRELRARAERALGAGFDIRSFHDMVLGSGAVPLDVLEANVDAWIRTAGGAGQP